MSDRIESCRAHLSALTGPFIPVGQEQPNMTAMSRDVRSLLAEDFAWLIAEVQGLRAVLGEWVA